MLKLALIFVAGSVTTFFAAPRLVYSGLQQQLFLGAGLKVAPDPSNVWSFHETVTLGSGLTHVPVVVDFDKNGKMDTELKAARVMVTDVQIYATGGTAGAPLLTDSGGTRWVFPELGGSGGRPPQVTVHFATPLVLPIDSGLTVTFRGVGGVQVTINMIGRLVTM